MLAERTPKNPKSIIFSPRTKHWCQVPLKSIKNLKSLIICFYFRSADNFLPLFNTRTTKNKYDFDENIVVIYNRVPKTASTSFVNLTYDLCKPNHFHVLHINVTGNNHVLSLSNQMKFARNITGWSEMKPAFYHGHMAFLDFSKWVLRFRWPIA